MRKTGTVVVLLLGTLSAFAQETVLPQKPKPAAKPAASVVAAPKPPPTPAHPAATAAKPAPAPKPAAATTKPASPAALSPKDTYNAMLMAERVAIQTDLIWAGEYNGLANGDFTDLAIKAIKSFQKKFKTKETGIL